MTINFRKFFLLHHFFSTSDKPLHFTWRGAGNLKQNGSLFYQPEACHSQKETTAACGLGATWPAEPRPAWDSSKHRCCCRPTPDKGFCSVRYWPFQWQGRTAAYKPFSPAASASHSGYVPAKLGNCQAACQHTAPERGFLVLVLDTEIIPQKRTSPWGSPQSELIGLNFYFFLHFPHEYTAIGQFPP